MVSGEHSFLIMRERASFLRLTFCQSSKFPCNPFVDVDRLLILHNRGANHWAVVALNCGLRSIEYYDSMECDHASRTQVQEVSFFYN